MQNDIARVVEELFQASALGGYIVPYENAETNRWSLWYVIPIHRAGAYGKYGRLVINICQLDEKAVDDKAPEEGRVIAAEVCVEGSGHSILDLGFTPSTESNAREVATKLVEWVREHTTVGVTVN